MRAVDIIQKKRDGGILNKDEIDYLIDGYSKGEIPDYQMSSWAMAVYFRGMDARETADLTQAMVNSGEQIDLSSIHGIKVDKHSTGGVGDKVTLVLGPLVAALGVPVAKMSGRGLGHTGGTIDKLESIEGFQVELTREQFLSQVNEIGIALVGQSGNLTPADKKLYGLRDVTATVSSIPLIASSVMSKKLASGADAIVLDVKTGDGAFMKSREDAVALAQAMVAIGKQLGRATVAVISDMSQPLGSAVGNALEVQEAIATLSGGGPADVRELCLTLGAQMVLLAGKAASVEEARAMLEHALDSGLALAKLQQFIAAQGGDASVVGQPDRLPVSRRVQAVPAPRSGYVAAIAAEQIGHAAMRLGAGRATKDDAIDHSVGIKLLKKVGDYVNKDEPIAILYVKHESELNKPDSVSEILEDETIQYVIDAFTFSDQSVQANPLIYEIIDRSKL